MKTKIICYNQVEYWNSKALALAFYRDCEKNTEGCERERYMNIIDDILDGRSVCTDGCSDVKTAKEAFFATPDNTRDYGGKVHYPIYPTSKLDKETVAKIMDKDIKDILEDKLINNAVSFVFHHSHSLIQITYVPEWKRVYVRDYNNTDSLEFEKLVERLGKCLKGKLNSKTFDYCEFILV